MGVASSGQTNDELVDNLVAADYVKTPLIESVLRAVDRGRYYLAEHRENAYRDLAWRHGNLHLSAPCIYAEALEALQLERAMSFLNVGSGTGYLSSLAGLIIGPYGLNHGIELHEDVMQYAMERQAEFIRTCAAFDDFEYCDAEFRAGNCLHLAAAGHRLYDRVYVGAACPPEHEAFMKKLIRVRGILVMPLDGQLVQITRTSETTWSVRSVLPVSFAFLIVPDKSSNTDIVELPDGSTRLHSLQAICRISVRRLLLSHIRSQHVGISSNHRRRCVTGGFARRRRHFNTMPTNIGMIVLDRFHDDSDTEVAEGEEAEEDDGPTPRTVSRRLRNAYRGMAHGLSHVMRQRQPRDEGIEEDMQEGAGEAAADDDDEEEEQQQDSSSDNEEDMSMSAHSTPMLSVPRRRRCTSSVSTSCTSGVGTCSSMDETDADIHDTSPGGSTLSNSEASNGKTSVNGSAEVEGSNGKNGPDWLHGVDSNHEESTTDEDEEEEEDVEMEKTNEDTCMKDDSSKCTVTISCCLQEKVHTLPIPLTLRQYLLFYRDADLQ